MGTLKEDINNYKMWRATGFKKHNSYVCMPSIGTPWVNKLSNLSGVTTSSERFILSDPFGDKIGISANKLSKQYKFINGEPINTETLTKRLEGHVLDWQEIESKSGIMLWSFHLTPKKYGNSCKNFQINTQKGIVLANKSGIQHGIGDFLVCDDLYGRPNFDTVRVVNGRLFVVTYDMRSFPGLVDASETICKAVEPATIFTPEKSKQIKERKLAESKKELASQLEQCYDTLGLCATILIMLYFGKYLSTKDINTMKVLLHCASLDGGTIATNIGNNVAALGTSVLKFETGTKLYVRMAISTNNKLACTLQLVDKNGAVITSTLSNNTELCKNFLFSIRKYRNNMLELANSADMDLKNKTYQFVNISKEVLKGISKDIFDLLMKSGESSFNRCMESVISEIKKKS